MPFFLPIPIPICALADTACYRPTSTYAARLARPRVRRARGRRCVAGRTEVRPRAGQRGVHRAGACRGCGARGERRKLEQPRVDGERRVERVVACVERAQLHAPRAVGGVVYGDDARCGPHGAGGGQAFAAPPAADPAPADDDDDDVRGVAWAAEVWLLTTASIHITLTPATPTDDDTESEAPNQETWDGGRRRRRCGARGGRRTPSRRRR